MKLCKCKYPDGIMIKPDGVNELDPCLYETDRILTNCTVIISKCTKCGNIDVSWKRTDDTLEIEDSDLFEYFI